MNATVWKSAPWDDVLLLEESLTEEERMIRDQAKAFCQSELMPGILEANRHEKFDRNLMSKMGEMGFLGPTIHGLTVLVVGMFPMV
jgi:glutaryl-CoA dehydrogenase